MKRPGWTSRREPLGPADSIEIFRDPEGHEFKRASAGETPDLEVALPHGLPPMRLVNIDHWRAPAEATP